MQSIQYIAEEIEQSHTKNICSISLFHTKQLKFVFVKLILWAVIKYKYVALAAWLHGLSQAKV